MADLEGISTVPLTGSQRERTRRLRYGLQALLEVHFTKGDRAYVPLLNRLSPAKRRQLHDRLSGGDHGHHHQEET